MPQIRYNISGVRNFALDAIKDKRGDKDKASLGYIIAMQHIIQFLDREQNHN